MGASSGSGYGDPSLYTGNGTGTLSGLGNSTPLNPQTLSGLGSFNPGGLGGAMNSAYWQPPQGMAMQGPQVGMMPSSMRAALPQQPIGPQGQDRWYQNGPMGMAWAGPGGRAFGAMPGGGGYQYRTGVPFLGHSRTRPGIYY